MTCSGRRIWSISLRGKVLWVQFVTRLRKCDTPWSVPSQKSIYPYCWRCYHHNHHHDDDDGDDDDDDDDDAFLGLVGAAGCWSTEEAVLAGGRRLEGSGVGVWDLGQKFNEFRAWGMGFGVLMVLGLERFTFLGRGKVRVQH